MKIGVIGTGYVGLVQGVVLAQFGLQVQCMDVDVDKIEKLKKGIVPIYEPGLKEMLLENLAEKRISFTTDYNEICSHADVIFIAVGTPANEDGSADLQYVESVAHEIGKQITAYKVIVTKSTVPVGTNMIIKDIVQCELNKRELNFQFDVASNPEFLREGKALNDCMNPDRIVIGTDSEKARTILNEIYGIFNTNHPPIINTSIATAEMIKYASNAFLAVKISFINEMALLAEKAGANIQEISKAMGMDGRISPKFLHAGPGYGGSCFPKDTKAIVNIGSEYHEDMMVIKAAIEANEKQKRKMVEKIYNQMGDVKEKTISILGLSFKPETDDMRAAPSIDIIKGLVKLGANIKTYCPKGMEEAKWRLSDCEDAIYYAENEYDCASEADAVVLMTEWNQFRGLDLCKLKELMNDNYFFDFRNVFAKRYEEMTSIFNYHGIGF